ncbi:MAG: J domain-containing protein [Enterovibrio sp.]
MTASEADEKTGAAGSLSVVSAGNSVEQPETSTAATVDLPLSTSTEEASCAIGAEKLRKRDYLRDFFRPMTPEKIRKKLDKAWDDGGAFPEIAHRASEMRLRGHLPSAPANVKDMLDKFAEGKKVLAKFNVYAQVWKDDRELTDKIRNTCAVLLNALLWNENLDSARKEAGLSHWPTNLLHKSMISSYLQGFPSPWDIDSMYNKIKTLLDGIDCSAFTVQESQSVAEVELDAFSLADVSLNSTTRLPRACCLKALELTSQAEEEEVVEAYMRLCLQYHPEKNLDNPEYAEKMFWRLQIVASSLRL